MKSKDVIKHAKNKVLREKKNIYFVLIITICTVVVIGVYTYKNMFMKSVNNTIENDSNYRNILIFPRDEDVDKYGNDYEYTFEDIYEIDHVVDIYSLRRNEFLSLDVTTYEDGTINFVRGTEYTLPKDVIGETFSEDDTGVAVCPIDFYPYLKEPNLYGFEYSFLDGKELIGTTFTVEGDIEDRVNGEVIDTGEDYKKDFKIIGVYDSAVYGKDPNSCYISAKDLDEIYDVFWSFRNPNSMSATVVKVDDRSNMNYVMQEMSALGYSVNGPQAGFDSGPQELLKLICNAIVAVAIVVTIVLTIAYVKKKVINDSYDIGLLKALGYQKNDILKINVAQIIMIALAGYVIGLFMFEIVYWIASRYFKSYMLWNYTIIEHYIGGYIVALIVVLAIPAIVDMILIKNRIKRNAISIIKSE